MTYIFPQEREALEMLAGSRPRSTEAWARTCWEIMSREGLCTAGPNYRLTAAGWSALAPETAEQLAAGKPAST